LTLVIILYNIKTKMMIPTSLSFKAAATRRMFSTFSRVLGNSIEISTHMPPKMRIPVG